ncbi:hypothetical protein BU16DRAFT_595905 [Lophium mytilinum]|uniref:Uncharacterized protein n=1 Tax=Lophium mytilinum TaxID=390894 RepID=A0A6A6QG20_9PEZI|nr:hypothetical protein BU16DRAFT_595905 [Lophium mytilinum]
MSTLGSRCSEVVKQGLESLRSLFAEEDALPVAQHDAHPRSETSSPIETISSPQAAQEQDTPQSSPKLSVPHNGRWIFAVEEETDYTFGPARMIEAFDHGHSCAAMLLSFGLSQKIKAALNDRRSLQDWHIQVQLQREHIAARDGELNASFFRQDIQLEKLEIAARKMGDDVSAELQQKMKELQASRRDITVQRAKLEEEEKRIDDRWQMALSQQRVLREEVDVILEDVFVNCQLLQEPQDPSFGQHNAYPPVARRSCVQGDDDSDYLAPGDITYPEDTGKAVLYPENTREAARYPENTRETEDSPTAHLERDGANPSRKRIHDWLDNSGGESISPPPPSEPEMDHWSVDSDKRFESVSVLAEEPLRKKIDWWRQKTRQD